MNRIKQLRDEFNISQNELGKKLNKTQQQISLYEKGINELDLDGYLLLSKLFNCSIEYIAGKSDVRNPSDFNENDLHIALSQADSGYISDELKDNIINYVKFVIEEEKRKDKENGKNGNK